MFSNVFVVGIAVLVAYLVIVAVRTILKSKALLAAAIYFGGYAYYNKEWPSLEDTIEHLKGFFMLM